MNYQELIIGEQKENSFASLFLNVIRATQKENKNEKFDFRIVLPIHDKYTKIDVKGLKKQNRPDERVDENFHWVEFVNVAGDRGSLYGDADYFALETFDYWVIVDKLRLQSYMEDRTNGKKLERSKNPYTLYQRTGRKDVISKVKTIDMIYISTMLIKKPEGE